MIESPIPISVATKPTRSERLLETRRSLEKTPVVEFAIKAIVKLNDEVLGGAGMVGWEPGEEGLLGLTILWGWEGEVTKGSSMIVGGKEVRFTPFYVRTTVVDNRDGPINRFSFKSVGRFSAGKDGEEISLGTTVDLDTEQLASTLRHKRNDILASRRR